VGNKALVQERLISVRAIEASLIMLKEISTFDLVLLIAMV
jgi:hypothetical protein